MVHQPTDAGLGKTAAEAGATGLRRDRDRCRQEWRHGTLECVRHKDKRPGVGEPIEQRGRAISPAKIGAAEPLY